MHRWPSLLLALAGCSDEGLTLLLEDASARTLVVLRVDDDGATRGTVIAPPDDLAGLRASLAGETEATLVRYDSAPSALGLPRGLLAPPSLAAGSRRLPPNGAVLAATVREEDGLVTVLTRPAATPPALAEDFRFAGPCPTEPTPPPIDVDPYCTPVFQPRPGDCYGPPVELTELADPGKILVGAVRQERGDTWMYLSSTRWSRDGFSRHGRLRLRDARTPALTSHVPIESQPAILGEAPRFQIAGWVGPPRLRSDGLEMFYASSYPDQVWQDQDGYVSARASVEEDFAIGTNTPAMGNAINPDDGVMASVLLADHRTAVYLIGQNIGELFAAHRRGPSGEEFETIGAVRDANGNGVSGASDVALSCDGGHLLYALLGRVYLARITAMPARQGAAVSGAVELAAPERLTLPPQGVLAEISSITESEDCESLYAGDGHRVIVYQRVPCE